MTEPSAMPLPYTDDVDTGGFWAAAAEERLVLCVCVSCESILHLPKAYCHVCGSWDTSWREVRPTGTLYTWTVVRQQLHPAFPVPSTMVLVDLDDAPGTRLLGSMPGAPELRAGMPLRARFDEVAPGVRLVQWEPADSSDIGGAPSAPTSV